MKPKFLFISILLFFFVSAFSQNENSPKNWKYSLGYTMVDSRVPGGIGGLLKDYFDGFSDWNSYSLPTNVAVEMSLTEKWALQAEGSYATIKKGFYYEEEQTLSNDAFYAIDLKAKYYLNKVGHTSKFEPYVAFGIGTSKMTGINDFKVNAGYGFQYWFHKSWGLKWESGYFHNFKENFPDFSGTATDYYQHSIGVVYQPKSSSRTATWEKNLK